MMKTAHHCVVTVTSDDFVCGTLVTLHSFLRCNRWFSGEIIVLHEALSPASRALLQTAMPQAILTPASAALGERLDALTAERPNLASRRARLLSLDAFRFAAPGRLLFCDSDLLFRSDVSLLFEERAPLIACPDGAAIRGKVRDPQSFAEQPVQEGGSRLTFNAGLMSIGAELRGEAAWHAVLALVTADSWKGVTTDHTDQLLLNRAFASRTALADASYNLMLLHRRDAHDAAGVTIDNAKVLHFNGPLKPWRPEAFVGAAARDPALIAAYRLWHQAYVALLSGLALADMPA